MIYFNPAAVYGPLAAAFPIAVAQASSVAVKTAPARTGELRRSIQSKSSGFSGAIYSNARHAAAQEFGTSPHVISPTNKKALAGNGFGPVAYVNHPGSSGSHFMSAAANAFRPLFVATASRFFIR